MAVPGSKAAPFPALYRLDRVLLLAVAVASFVVLDGPVWRHLFDWDRAIGWSYATVPLLVLVALALRHRFSWMAWFLHSLELVFWKFAVTAGILMVILARTTPEQRAPAPWAPVPAVTATAPPKPALPPPPLTRGRIEGRVLRNGAPASSDTLVFISTGLGNFAWPAPTSSLQLTNAGQGFEPALAAAQVGETITATSADHRLHTLLLTQAGNAWRLNAPVLASGAPTPIRPSEVEGVVTATCAVHGAAEHASTLVLLRHPFFQRLGPNGRFAFEGVPPGLFALTALAPDGSRAEMSAPVAAGQTAHAEGVLQER